MAHFICFLNLHHYMGFIAKSVSETTDSEELLQNTAYRTKRTTDFPQKTEDRLRISEAGQVHFILLY